MCVSSHKLLVLPFLSGERFFFFNAGSADRILIFATDDNLRHLCDLETIYVDRTQICPSLFIQLFTINSFIHGQQFLLIYASLEVDKVTTKQMNEAVREELQHQQSDAVWSRKRKAYVHFTNEQQAAIGKYTAENDNSAAVKKFKSNIDGQLGESTVHLFKQKYYQKLKKAKERRRSSQFPAKEEGAPLTLGENDQQVQA